MSPAPLSPHPDRLLPADPGTRAIARELYARVADLPIVSPHGHVPAEWLADDTPFSDPTTLLLTPRTTTPTGCCTARPVWTSPTWASPSARR